MVMQLIRDYEDVQAVNAQLEKMYVRRAGLRYPVHACKQRGARPTPIHLTPRIPLRLFSLQGL